MADTQAPTLPAGSRPDPPPPPDSIVQAAARAGLVTAGRRGRALSIVASVLAFAVLVGVSIAAALPSKWFVETENRRLGVDQPAPYARVPASAQPVDDLVRIGDLGDTATQYVPAGEFMMVTVMEPEQTLLSWLVGSTHPAVQFLTDEGRNGFRTPQQNRTLSLASMRTSEQVAQYVALDRLGYEVALVPGEVLIEDLVCLEPLDDVTCDRWSPSDAVLDPGDKILEVEGRKIETVDDLSAVLADKEPGDLVPMRVERPGEGELDVVVELTASPDDPDRTIVGFYPFDTARVDLPFEMEIDPRGVGGPSAGLAFTLTIIDELTEGELTGGGRVAVTGTINLNGTVGAIGGLRQKASAVAQAGVDLFLVPASQSEDDIAAARLAAGDAVEIVPVATVDEALAALAEHGGDPFERTTTSGD